MNLISTAEYDLSGTSFEHSTVVRGTTLSAEWAAVRIRRVVEEFGASVEDSSTTTQIRFTKQVFRSGRVSGIVTVAELPDGIKVTAAVNAVSEIVVPVVSILLVAALYHYSVLDALASSLFGGLLAVGTAIRAARIATMLRGLTRAGTATDESHAD